MSAEPMSNAFAGAQPAPQAMVPQGPLTYSPRQRPGGDSEALIRQHLPMVRRIAWHVHGSMSTIVDVEDLVQIGLVALVEAVGQAAEQGAQFKAYLQTRLRGAMIDELRRQATTTRGAMRRRRQYQAAIAAVTARTGRAPESDLRDTLIAAIGALPEREALVIQLYYVEELNLEEIGQVLGVGSARVCQIKAAAHAKLKKALARKV